MIEPIRLSITRDPEKMATLAHALSSPLRIEIMKLLTFSNLTIKEIAATIEQPLCSTLGHIRTLEQAGLIQTQVSYTSKGKSRTCYRSVDIVELTMFDPSFDIAPRASFDEFNIAIGSYFDYSQMSAPCGMATPVEGAIGNDNDLAIFCNPERYKASIIWFTHGILEYRVPLPSREKLARLAGIEISFEACSEAPLYNNDYKSDISVLINDKLLGVWTSPGDFGGRKGLLNPSFWPVGFTQYGEINSWKVDDTQTTLNSKFASFTNLHDLALQASANPYVSLKIGVSPDADHVGGMNLFGKYFGDYPQDIMMKFIYR